MKVVRGRGLGAGRFKYVHYYLFPPEIYPFSLPPSRGRLICVYIYAGIRLFASVFYTAWIEALRIQGPPTHRAMNVYFTFSPDPNYAVCTAGVRIAILLCMAM